MPRKTKDSENNENKSKIRKSKKTTTTKKASTAKKVTTKKAEVKKTTKKKAVTKKPVTKKAETKKTSTKKKAEKKKASAKKTLTKKTAVTKKTATKKATKTTTKKKAEVKKTNTKKTIDVVEYYDLPYRYNQTIVKVLAQTPTNLFIYWDISDEDRQNYKKQFGENFFETTKPILKIYNDTMHYDFEVEINDFANSWYLHVNDSKCDYRVELARRPIDNSSISEQYIQISTSNEIESPNDKILFDKMQKMVYFKNVKTNGTRSKSIANLSFIRNMGKIYNIYDLYKKIYKDENIKDLNNPSSNFF